MRVGRGTYKENYAQGDDRGDGCGADGEARGERTTRETHQDHLEHEHEHEHEYMKKEERERVIDFDGAVLIARIVVACDVSGKECRY
eukprot:746604-Hanusia_phi.AAC.2